VEAAWSTGFNEFGERGHDGVEGEYALMAQLRAHFDEGAIVELTALIAFRNMSSKFNAAGRSKHDSWGKQA
jgi:alkylhydroperoxidase family enzyme